MIKNTIENDLIEIFEKLHKNPELSFKEYETTKTLKGILKEFGIEILDLNLDSGLVAQIKGEHPGPVIALRSDIDALPIQEKTELPYQSLVPGVMHACGHDFHMTSVLGAARLLSERKSEIHGTIKVIFQPAEEAPGGAKVIIDTGILEDVKAYFGIHATPSLPVGTVGISEGAVMAAVDKFSITVKGKGSHAAHPNEGIDPIVVSSAIVMAVQSIVSRNMNPFSQGVVSITHLEAGNTWNVIPEHAYMEGTVRTMKPEDRVLFENRLRSLVINVAEAYGAEAEFNWQPGPPAVINDGELADLSKKVALKNGYHIREAYRSLGGEDFSLYLKKEKGIFLRIGTGGEFPIHHPKFSVEPKAIMPTAQYLADLAIEFLLLV